MSNVYKSRFGSNEQQCLRKRGFWLQTDALATITRAARHGIVLTSYKCMNCPCFHLTSNKGQPRKQSIVEPEYRCSKRCFKTASGAIEWAKGYWRIRHREPLPDDAAEQCKHGHWHVGQGVDGQKNKMVLIKLHPMERTRR